MPDAPLRILSIGQADSPQFVQRTTLFVRLGHQVVELTGRSRPVAGGRHVLEPKGPPLGRLWRIVALGRVLHALRLTRREHFDLVFVHYAQGLWAWMAPALGWPVVVSIMGGDILFDEQGAPTCLERAATLALIRASGAAVCKSAYLAERVIQACPRTEVVTCAWEAGEGVPTDEGRKVRAELGISDAELVVFSPRAMRPMYGIHLIVEAFARAGLGSGTKLLLSTYKADPGYEAGLRGMCTELGVPAVFLPPLDGAAMAAHLRGADIGVSLPESDGLPQTYIEASRNGLAMIMADLPNYGGVLSHGRDAWLCGRSVGELARALRTLAFNASLRDQLAVGAGRLVNGLCGDAALAALDKALRRTAAGPSPGVRAAVAQLCRVAAILLTGRPVVARRGQPVFSSLRAFLAALMGRADPS